jgi:hypothetical protein
LIGLVIAIQLGWLGWVLTVQLPNAHNAGVDISRGGLLLMAFPAVVPGTSFRDSLFGLTLKELGHFENLSQRLPIVLAATLIASAAVSIGALILRLLRIDVDAQLGRFERLAVCYGLGCGGLGILTLGLGRAALLHPVLIRVGLGLIVAMGVMIARPWMRGQATAREPAVPARSSWSGFWLLGLLPFVVVMLLGSMLPATDFDVVEYHLQGPKEFFLSGRIAFLPHNVYTSMPFGIEMLHLLGMEVLNDWWWGALVGQTLVAAFAPAAAVLIATTARRIGSERAGWMAALVYLSTPWIYRLAVIAYVEGPLCYYHAALIWGWFALRTDPKTTGEAQAYPSFQLPPTKAWSVLGLLAGCAMACKYPALISAVIPFGLLSMVDSWRLRSSRPLLSFVLGWTVLMAPWLVRNVIDTGNPVYPLGYSVFGGRHWDTDLDQKWSAGHGRRPVTREAFISSIKEVAGQSDWQSPLYVALAPLALLRKGARKQVLALWGFVAYLFLTWWLLTHRVDRFWLPLLSPLAILAGLGADWTRQRFWKAWLTVLLGIAVIGNFFYMSTALAGLNEWTGDLVFLRRDLTSRLNRPLATIDEQLPPDARILLVGQAAVFHVRHPIIYNVVFNHETLELLAAGRTPQQFREELQRLGITHIFVDWQEIHRHRKLGGYGFTDFVTPQRFSEWTRAKILTGPQYVGPAHELYTVVSDPMDGSARRTGPDRSSGRATPAPLAEQSRIEVGNQPEPYRLDLELGGAEWTN